MNKNTLKFPTFVHLHNVLKVKSYFTVISRDEIFKKILKFIKLEGEEFRLSNSRSIRNWTIIPKHTRPKVSRNSRRNVPVVSLVNVDVIVEAVSLSCKFISPRPLVGYFMSDNLFTARQQPLAYSLKNPEILFPGSHTRTSKCETCVTICGHSCEFRGVL